MKCVQNQPYRCYLYVICMLYKQRFIERHRNLFIYTAHKKFRNTSTSAESVASIELEGRYLENQTP